MIKFLQSSYDELKLVSWPTRAEATRLCLIIAGMSIFISLFVAGADFVYNKLLELIIN